MHMAEESRWCLGMVQSLPIVLPSIIPRMSREACCHDVPADGTGRPGKCVCVWKCSPQTFIFYPPTRDTPTLPDLARRSAGPRLGRTFLAGHWGPVCAVHS